MDSGSNASLTQGNEQENTGTSSVTSKNQQVPGSESVSAQSMQGNVEENVDDVSSIVDQGTNNFHKKLMVF
jgi:formylglycine-generating enzyme required for sulfatase activity